MTPFNTRKLKDCFDYRWLGLLAGIILVIIGIWASTRPMETYATRYLYFDAAILVLGVLIHNSTCHPVKKLPQNDDAITN